MLTLFKTGLYSWKHTSIECETFESYFLCNSEQLRDGTGNAFSDIKNTFAESLQLQMSVLHQSMWIFKVGLSSLSDDWGKYKEKVPDMPDPNQNVETICNSKLKFTELKDLFIKRVQKN